MPKMRSIEILNRPLFKKLSPPILLAAALFACDDGESLNDSKKPVDVNLVDCIWGPYTDKTTFDLYPGRVEIILGRDLTSDKPGEIYWKDEGNNNLNKLSHSANGIRATLSAFAKGRDNLDNPRNSTVYLTEECI